MNEYRISPPLTAPLSPPFLQARTLLADSLRVRFRLGEFDPPAGQAWLRYGVDDIHTAADEAAAEDAARQALVLLLNGGRGGGAAPLPLDATASSPVAVIGPHGNDTLTLQARQKGGQRGGLHGVRWGGCRCLPCFYSEAAKAATLASISPPSPLPTSCRAPTAAPSARAATPPPATPPSSKPSRRGWRPAAALRALSPAATSPTRRPHSCRCAGAGRRGGGGELLLVALG